MSNKNEAQMTDCVNAYCCVDKTKCNASCPRYSVIATTGMKDCIGDDSETYIGQND